MRETGTPAVEPGRIRRITTAADPQIRPLADLYTPEFFRLLASDYREAYWQVLASYFERLFRETPGPLLRPEAIDIAQSVLERASGLDLNPKEINWVEELNNAPVVEDDYPDPRNEIRQSALNLIRRLLQSGWMRFEYYGEYGAVPALEFTITGQRLVAYLYRELYNERPALRSFADRLNDLIGQGYGGFQLTPGRLRRLREVVGQLNERIHELLASIKQQSEDAVVRARTVRAILRDLLVDFEREVGYDYVLLQRQEAPPRLWERVRGAVHYLRSQPWWLHREAEWYQDEFQLDTLDEARDAVQEDMAWIVRVTDSLARASELLDRRYGKYVGNARRRVEAHLRHTYNVADGLRALLEHAAAGRVELERIRVPHITTVSPLGLMFDTADRGGDHEPQIVPVVDGLSDDEAARDRMRLEEDIPFRDVMRWLRSTANGGTSVHTDELPLDGLYDYLLHIYGAFYGEAKDHALVFTAERCTADVAGCPDPTGCTACYRRADGLRVARGTYRWPRSIERGEG